MTEPASRSHPTTARTRQRPRGGVPPAKRTRVRGRGGAPASPATRPATETVPAVAGDDRVPAPPLASLVRWAALCLLIVVAAAGAGYGLSAVQQPVYGAQTDILYRVADGSGARAERDLATQQVILQGRSVLQPVAEEAGLAVEDLQERLSVEVVGQSDVLRVVVEHHDPAVAVDLARTISEHYVRTVADSADAARDQAADFVQEQADELAESLEAVEAELAELGAGSSAERARLETEAEELQERIAGLEDLLGGRVAPGGAEVRVLTPAYLLEDPLAPQPLRAAVAGGIAGLVVVSALAGLLARRWGYV